MSKRTTIWKFPIDIADEQLIVMPAGARLLTAQAQGGEIPCLWAAVDPTAPRVARRLLLLGTGHYDRHGATDLPHVGTFQMHGGALVFHLFDAGEMEDLRT